MKKSLIILFALLQIFTGKNYSQEKERPFHFGLHISPNLSWIKPKVEGVLYKSDGVLAGISYGADFEYDFTPNIGILTGVNIVHTGGPLEYQHVQDIMIDTISVRTSGIKWRRYNLQYLEIPILVVGHTGKISWLADMSLYGRFGIGSGFNLKARAKEEFLPDNSATGEKILKSKLNVKDDVSFFRESMIIGVGAEYYLGAVAALQFGLTYNNGFTNILRNKSTYNTSVNEKGHSNFIEIYLGLMF